ncbi:MAG: serine/threonine protein kinase, partial [Candidatus Obscuribacterales bacterium]|nr:serine/threonine protein kinase [Candidatus Obscuribacterales bacterium]
MSGKTEGDPQAEPATTGSGRQLDADPFIGASLDGRFIIEEILGTGGMSVVYKARQLVVDRYVAIKTLKLRVDTKPIFRERFKLEVKSLCALSHPHIVTVYDCIIGQDDQPYIVMDYLRGRSLEKLLRDQGALPMKQFERIFAQVLSALDHAHKKGIIHRDIKPGNIVLVDD